MRNRHASENEPVRDPGFKFKKQTTPTGIPRSIRNLKHLFRPRSVAVIGASNQADSVGAVLMRNLLQGGFAGPVMPVNPKYTAVAGVLTYPDVASLPLTPDLAVIATPPATVRALIGELAVISL
ncbi:MAG: CoA-binding protein [Pseudomonadota bacterium]